MLWSAVFGTAADSERELPETEKMVVWAQHAQIRVSVKIERSQAVGVIVVCPVKQAGRGKLITVQDSWLDDFKAECIPSHSSDHFAATSQY